MVEVAGVEPASLSEFISRFVHKFSLFFFVITSLTLYLNYCASLSNKDNFSGVQIASFPIYICV